MGLKKFYSTYSLKFCFLLILTSCKLGEVDFDGIEAPVYEAEVSVALAESSYSLTDLIIGTKDSSLTISEAPNGLITIQYVDSSEFVFEGLDLLILLADPSLQQEFVVQQQEVPMTFFREFESGEVIFENPRITYTVDNYYGVPIGFFFDNVSTSRTDTMGVVTRENLAGDVLESPAVFDATEGIGVTPNRTSFSITPGNSTLQDLFKFLPLNLNNSLRGIVNPDNEAISGNVVGENGRLEIKTRIELPLQAVVDSLVTIIDFDMNDGLSFGEADSVTLRIVTLNSTPLDGHMVMEFFSADSVKLYDVPQSQAFQSATVGPRSKTVEPDVFIDDIPLDSLGLEALANTAYINATVAMNSFKLDSRDVVAFFSNYSLDIVVTAIVKVEEEF